jgi:hypothetical protein
MSEQGLVLPGVVIETPKQQASCCANRECIRLVAHITQILDAVCKSPLIFEEDGQTWYNYKRLCGYLRLRAMPRVICCTVCSGYPHLKELQAKIANYPTELIYASD